MTNERIVELRTEQDLDELGRRVGTVRAQPSFTDAEALKLVALARKGLSRQMNYERRFAPMRDLAERYEKALREIAYAEPLCEIIGCTSIAREALKVSSPFLRDQTPPKGSPIDSSIIGGKS